MRRAFRPWLLCLAISAAVSSVGAAHVWHRAPSPLSPGGVELCPPDSGAAVRLEAKVRITTEVIAGRETLLEAASAFKEQDADRTHFSPVMVMIADPSMSVDEGYCRVVIAWVRHFLSPGQTDGLTRALEAELAARLREGTVRLPEGVAGSDKEPASAL